MLPSELERLFGDRLKQLPQEAQDLLRMVILFFDVQVQELEARIKELEDQLSKNSRNSSKPPSSDPSYRKTKSLRGKSRKKPGGQKGHKGHRLDLVAQPDHVQIHRLDRCPHCQTDFAADETGPYDRRQIFDIPPMKIEITEHRAQNYTCSCCGQKSQAAFPVELTQRTQYGPRIKGLSVYLLNYQMLSWSRTVQFFNDLFGHRPSEGSLQNFQHTAARNLEDFENKLRECLQQAAVVNCDETGARCAGKRYWLHSRSTARWAQFHIHSRRGRKAMDDFGILPEFKGVAVHDAYSSYWQYQTCAHALCNAHLLRELTFIEERCQQGWATKLKELLLRIKAAVDRTDPEKGALDKRWQVRYQNTFRKILQEGFDLNPPPQSNGKRGRTAKGKPLNLLERLRDRQEAYLLFMKNFLVPFDNNMAERDLRMIKVKLKVAGCLRSLSGAHVYVRIRSYIVTAQKQAMNIHEALTDIFNSNPSVYQNLVSA